ncbi:MAG: HEAT repeat domain-containing protein [Pyrinomonadaceae bacterium]
MRTKLLATILLAAASAAAIAVRGAHAQTPAPRVVEVQPPVVIDTSRIAPVAISIPDVQINMPDVFVQMPPMPAIAPIALPDFDFNYSFSFNGDDIWIGDAETTEREELRQTYQLSANARVELSNIDGAVVIDTTDGNTAEVVVKSYSYAANPRKLSVEQTASSLVLRGPERKLKGDTDWSDGTRHTVRLTLPRRVNLVMTNVRDSVRVGELDGTVKLDGVAGRVGIAQAAGSAEIANVTGGVTLGLTRLSGRGVSISNVAGRVTLRFIDEVNAELQTSGVKGKVYVELPNVAVQGEMSKSDFRAKVGAGGAPVAVSDVTGTVRLAKGQTMAEMLTVLKASDRGSARSQSVSDLTLYVSNPQVRQAFVEALRDGQSSQVQMAAASALTPYVNEPEVRDAFLRALESDKNESVRVTAASALARKYAGDKDVRDRLLRDLATEKRDAIRMTIIGAVGKYIDDPAVMRAMIDAMRDEKDNIRARAARSLATKVENGEVYDLLLTAARNDQKRLVRAVALDGLSRRIKERPELRELFVGYLDDESQSMQYHALKGLVELGDTGLKPRLVEKARELILVNYRRNWNDSTVLSTLLLLRKLDPQEADRMLEQMGSERVRSF